MPRRTSDLGWRDAGATWLDLLATVGGAYGPEPVERLTDADRLATFLARADLAPDLPPEVDDVAAAIALREVLRSLVLSAVAGGPPDPVAVAALDRRLATDRPPRVAVRAARITASAPPTSAQALARIARQAAEHLTGPVADQLGRCGDPICGMVFWDPTGRRRWCSAQTCGVRHRVRAHRARAADPRPAEPPTDRRTR